ncbi:uncharacterized protein LOC128206589 [Mya arenaria]|uniref:uncharacterized protein LOC128206589 n=1 Tax=Mya arenaria TaxID=6604 RepID=UPI0022E59842|nr:uncharacterized protein LOC128206589 [Mya arenaria]
MDRYLQTLLLFCVSQIGLTGSSFVSETCSNGTYQLDIGVDNSENGGSSVCTCPDWIGTTRCCKFLEKLRPLLPTCDPRCENEGVCIANDTCDCVNGFIGSRCQIGSDLPEGLRPQLHLTLPENELYEDLSWYDAPPYSWSNKACFIKIVAQNAPAETLFSAESSRMDVVPGSFGNFTSGVINENGSVLGSSRFACMQVRCPSASLEGIPFDVRVTVTASMSICKLSTSALSGDAYSVERLVDGDVAHIDLQNGDNYGSKFGVYMSSGTRKKALYLAREACCSGNEFVITDIAPDMGVALHYTCA